MQSSGEHSEPPSEPSKEQDVPLAIDNLLLQKTEDELQTVTSDGVCVIVDGSLGFAQTMEQPSLHHKPKETFNDNSLDITNANKSSENETNESHSNGIEDSHFSDNNSATSDNPQMVFDEILPDELNSTVENAIERSSSSTELVVDQETSPDDIETTMSDSPINAIPTQFSESANNESVQTDLNVVEGATGCDAPPSEGAEV